MSQNANQPKRFSIVGHEWIGDILEEKPDGEYVLHSDYAALVQQGIRDHADWRSKLNFLEADYKAEIARLTAENERLKASQLSLEKWIACEQAHFETADNLREKLYQASVQIERLRKAGEAAKEGRDAK